jgi:hypothetical protein
MEDVLLSPTEECGLSLGDGGVDGDGRVGRGDGGDGGPDLF